MNGTGRIFRIGLFGESHGHGIGVTIDGCPPGVPLTSEDFNIDLSRRRAGKAGTTPRVEDDLPDLISGHFNGHTTGAPLTIMFRNMNVRSGDYSDLREIPRPGHSDFVAYKRYKGFNDYRGGGHFSGRLTLCLVAAGVVAKKLITPVTIEAVIINAGGEKDIGKAVAAAMEDGDSVGGIVECIARDIPVGWGEPFFDSVESVISHLVFSIPAIKGVEFGSGFNAASMRGSEHNDLIVDDSGRTATNNAGGISGGITNGNDLVFRVAVKPTSSISVTQSTYSIKSGNIEELKVKGRHDACIALRVPVVLEAITAIALADFKLMAEGRS